MLSRLFRFFAAPLLLFSLALPFAAAQSDVSIERGVKADPKPQDEQGSSSPAAFPYFVLIVYTLLIMTIVCMPSRKA